MTLSETLRDALAGMSRQGIAELLRNGEDSAFHLGIAGSRNMAHSGPQYEVFTRAIVNLASQPWLVKEGKFCLHHGCCIGADEIAHYQGRIIKAVIHGHPGTLANGSYPYRMECSDYDVLHKEKLYKDRNQDIVNMGTGALLAAPAYPEDDRRSKRSGTWQTIRMARKNRRRIIIVYADGHIYGDIKEQ